MKSGFSRGEIVGGWLLYTNPPPPPTQILGSHLSLFQFMFPTFFYSYLILFLSALHPPSTDTLSQSSHIFQRQVSQLPALINPGIPPLLSAPPHPRIPDPRHHCGSLSEVPLGITTTAGYLPTYRFPPSSPPPCAFPARDSGCFGTPPPGSVRPG